MNRCLERGEESREFMAIYGHFRPGHDIQGDQDYRHRYLMYMKKHRKLAKNWKQHHTQSKSPRQHSLPKEDESFCLVQHLLDSQGLDDAVCLW